VSAEHAVFTSVRSPWGRGYRIIAASAGISADEKREIVQRAPSHQSICAGSPHGWGLASFTMQSGRRCVLVAEKAGVEHSARGDCRVHVQVVVMEPAAYRRLRCDPRGVAFAARAALGADWLNDQPPANLPRLTLESQSGRAGHEADRGPAPGAADLDGLLATLSGLLRGRRILVHGPPDPLRALAWIWSGVPAAVRDMLALSCGLRFSPGRNFPLLLTEMPPGQRQQVGCDHDFDVIDWHAAEAPHAGEFDRWLDFARARWAAGELAQLDQLSAELTAETTAADLAHVAALWDDLARLAEADLALVDELSGRHAGAAPSGGAGARLHAEFHRAAALRREQLQRLADQENDARGVVPEGR
jgi:hypothetical protein